MWIQNSSALKIVKKKIKNPQTQTKHYELSRESNILPNYIILHTHRYIEKFKKIK